MNPIAKTILISTLSLGSLSSCSKGTTSICPNSIDSACIVNDTLTNIRIKNGSHYDFCNINIVGPDGSLVHYGALRAGKTTCYYAYKEAYSYTYINLTVDGEQYVLQPIDYIGETPLGIGKFTYLLDIDKAYKMITIKTSKD